MTLRRSVSWGSLLLVALLSWVSPIVPSQQPADETQKEQQARAEAERRARIRARIERLADRISAFDNTDTKVRGLASLAATICGQEPLLSRAFFLRADAFLPLASEAKVRNVPSAAPPDPASVSEETLLTSAARCDPSLAKQLRERRTANHQQSQAGEALQEASTSAAAAIQAARDGNAQDAAKLLKDALKKGGGVLWGDVNRGSNMPAFDIVRALENIRRKDAAAADRAFLETIAWVRALPSVDVNALQVLGIYLFNSPRAIEAGYGGTSTSTILVESGGLRVQMVNLTGNRPELRPETARAYLDAAVDILTRPAYTGEQKTYAYAALQQFLPKVREFAPERAGQLETIMQAFVNEVPGGIKGPKTSATLDDGIASMPGEEQIVAMADADKRDGQYLRLAWRLLENKDFGRAHDVARKIQDERGPTKLETVIDFQEGVALAEKGQLREAEQRAAKLPPGAPRVLLGLAIAQARGQTGRQQGFDTLFSALQGLEQVRPGERGAVLLAAAGVAAPWDAKLGLQFLHQAAVALNAGLVKRAPQTSAPAKAGAKPAAAPATTEPETEAPMQYIVKAGDARYTSVYRVPALKADLRTVAALLAASDYDATEDIVFTLQDEAVLGLALPALARVLLLPPPPR